jgi:nucleoside-diphosphate-sugar epimerase
MLERLVAFRNPETVFRMFLDSAIVAASILTGLWLVGSYSVFDLLGRDSTLWLPHILLFSFIPPFVHLIFGIYTHVRTYALPDKLYYVIASTTTAYLVAGFAFSFTQRLTFEKGAAYLLAWALSVLLMCGLRAGRNYLRREIVRDYVTEMTNEREKCVLVIGGAGYIGSALVPKLLDNNYRVIVLDKLCFGEGPIASFKDHPNVEFVREDFRDVGVLVRVIRKAGAIVHLGGLVGDPACAYDPELTIDINVSSTRLIGEIARAHGIRRLVFASSCSVYGACPEIVDENSRFNPQSLYARSKVASEVVLSKLCDGHFCPTYLRFGTIYGLSGRTRFDLVVNLLCAKAIRDGLITVFNGDQWRPFVHVDDVARAVYTALHANLADVANRAFNVGSNEQNLTLRDLGQRINAIVPSAKVVEMNENLDPRDYRVNFDRISKTLGFKPKWSIEDGIRQVIEAVREGGLGDYNDINYNNVLFLQARGSEEFVRRYNSGWEGSYLEITDLGAEALHSVRAG